MKLILDLDGVLRDLNKALRNRFNIPWFPDNWNFKYQEQGIFAWFKKDLTILETAPVTKYFSVIKEYFKDKKVEIWTCQSKEWESYTLRWIKKNFSKADIKILTTEQKEKLLYKTKNCFLIEDSPFFKNYSKIILIDYLYNRHVNDSIRVKTKKDLKKVLDNLTKEV